MVRAVLKVRGAGSVLVSQVGVLVFSPLAVGSIHSHATVFHTLVLPLLCTGLDACEGSATDAGCGGVSGVNNVHSHGFCSIVEEDGQAVKERREIGIKKGYFRTYNCYLRKDLCVGVEQVDVVPHENNSSVSGDANGAGGVVLNPKF